MSTVTDPERARVASAYARRDHGDRYAANQPDQQSLARERARVWDRHLSARGRGAGTVVELGCGEGRVLEWAADRAEGAVLGVDVLAGRLALARSHGAPAALAAGDARFVPVRSRAADVVVCSTLCSSVLDDEIRTTIAIEIDRVLAPDGIVLWFDFFRDNPRNPDVRKVTARDLERLFPGYAVDVERVVLAPPIARALRKHPRLAATLGALPPLRSHLAGALWRAQTRG